MVKSRVNIETVGPFSKSFQRQVMSSARLSFVKRLTSPNVSACFRLSTKPSASESGNFARIASESVSGV